MMPCLSFADQPINERGFRCEHKVTGEDGYICSACYKARIDRLEKQIERARKVLERNE